MAVGACHNEGPKTPKRTSDCEPIPQLSGIFLSHVAAYIVCIYIYIAYMYAYVCVYTYIYMHSHRMLKSHVEPFQANPPEPARPMLTPSAAAGARTNLLRLQIASCN